MKLVIDGNGESGVMVIRPVIESATKFVHLETKAVGVVGDLARAIEDEPIYRYANLYIVYVKP